VVYSRDIKREEVTQMATTEANTNYDWKNVSDEYLDEIIAIQMKSAKRFVAHNQQAKFERAMSNVDAAQAERRNRSQKVIDSMLGEIKSKG